MQLDVVGMRAIGLKEDHPINMDVDCRMLPKGTYALALEAIKSNTLLCHTDLGRGCWVSRAQLATTLGFGRRLYDPAAEFSVPADAVLAIPYLDTPITPEVARASRIQASALASARAMAQFLADLRTLMPPPQFDMHVRDVEACVSPLQSLIVENSVDAHPSHCGWWVSRATVEPLLPSNASLDDPESHWFVSPHDYIDHAEVERLATMHRRCWPEVYLGDAGQF